VPRDIGMSGSRRTVLKALGTGTVALTGVSTIANASEDVVQYLAGYKTTNQDAVSDGTPPKREKIYDTIPLKKELKIQAQENFVETVANRLENQGSKRDVELITRSLRSVNNGRGDPFVPGIRLRYRYVYGESPDVSLQWLRSEFEATQVVEDDEGNKRDIEVTVTEIEEREVSGKDDCYDDEYQQEFEEQVPGGVKISAEADDPGEENGTATAPFCHDTYGPGWATAAHLFNIDGTPGQENSDDYHPAYQPNRIDSRNYIGELAEYEYSENSGANFNDMAYIERKSTQSPDNRVYGSIYTSACGASKPIRGIRSNRWLRNNQDKLLARQGMHYGRNYEPYEYDPNYFSLTRPEVEHAAPAAPGDSGGPYFDNEINELTSEYEAFICGIIARKASFVSTYSNGSVGNTAQAAESALEGAFY